MTAHPAQQTLNALRPLLKTLSREGLKGLGPTMTRTHKEWVDPSLRLTIAFCVHADGLEIVRLSAHAQAFREQWPRSIMATQEFSQDDHETIWDAAVDLIKLEFESFDLDGQICGTVSVDLVHPRILRTTASHEITTDDETVTTDYTFLRYCGSEDPDPNEGDE